MAKPNDYDIANASGAAVRDDLNDVLGAIATLNSDATEPTTTYAYMLWADTSTTKLKMRNGANSAWVEVGSLDQAGLNIVASKFPNVASNVTLTDTQLNNTVYLVAGTKMIFFQSAPPTGWTQDATNNDKALRVVSSTGGGTGGSTGFSSAFTHTHSDTFSAAGHPLAESEMPAHKHNFVNDDNIGSADLSADGVTRVSSYGTGGSDGGGTLYKFTTNTVGGGGSHTHTINGSVTSATIAPHYIDVIVCQKS